MGDGCAADGEAVKICVWRTGHEIADTVAEAVCAGIPKADLNLVLACPENIHLCIKKYDVHIGYGILRGMADVFSACDKHNKPWFNVDRGYWHPSHYDGYYRISLGGTQQTGTWPASDWKRWEALQIPICKPQDRSKNWYDLYCPPTDYVASFFNEGNWLGLHVNAVRDYRIRMKDPNNYALDRDLRSCSQVITFNSSVGWEALRRGIPVESDPVHSIVGAWQAVHGTDKREELFATMAGLQLTLDEMRGGKLMPLLEKLLA